MDRNAFLEVYIMHLLSSSHVGSHYFELEIKDLTVKIK